MRCMRSYLRIQQTGKPFNYLRLEAKGVSAELSDAVVLQKNPLRVVRHASRHHAEVLGLAADRHRRRVAHTQLGTCFHPAWLQHQQPQNQPETKPTWRNGRGGG